MTDGSKSVNDGASVAIGASHVYGNGPSTTQQATDPFNRPTHWWWMV